MTEKADLRDEFRSKLLGHCERAMKISPHIKNEQATKLSLVQPFISLLGYDPLDPTEVYPEHSADFSEKYKNKVDYAIILNGNPVVAIEVKSVGETKKDDRGQLKSYFNALPTIKLGILTDGLKYEFFVDSMSSNMMDDEPFIVLDCEAIIKDGISDTVLDGFIAVAKQNFDPNTISDHAQQKHIYNYFRSYIQNQFEEPSIEFTRFLLRENEILHVRAASIEKYRNIAKSAFLDVFNSHVLNRLDISGSKAAKPSVPSDQTAMTNDRVDPDTSIDSIVTTQKEIEAFESVRRRLAFLVAGDLKLFESIQDILYRDYQGKMIVFYKKERKGRIIEIVEQKNKIIFRVQHNGESLESLDISSLDTALLGSFKLRVAELS